MESILFIFIPYSVFTMYEPARYFFYLSFCFFVVVVVVWVISNFIPFFSWSCLFSFARNLIRTNTAQMEEHERNALALRWKNDIYLKCRDCINAAPSKYLIKKQKKQQQQNYPLGWICDDRRLICLVLEENNRTAGSYEGHVHCEQASNQ